MDVLGRAAIEPTQKTDQAFVDQTRRREVQLWAVEDLTFSESYGQPVWVVHSQESWTEKKMVKGKKVNQPNQSDWWWMLDEKLEGYPLMMAYDAGHRRWGIENKAFNELTQYYHLEHCYHHEPVSMLAQMLILMLGFVLFGAYATLHSQEVRLGQITLKALAHEMDLALEAGLPWDLWFASLNFHGSNCA